MAEHTSDVNGGNDDYASLTLWEDDTDGDITAGDAEVALCYDDDGLLDESDTISFNATTDADSYRAIRGNSDDRHLGILSNGAAGNGFRVREVDGDNHLFQILEDYIRFEWLQITPDWNVDVNGKDAIYILLVGALNEIRIEHCIIVPDANCQGIVHKGIQCGDADAILYIGNNIIYDWDQANAKGIDIVNCTTAYIYNNTLYNCVQGLIQSSGTVISKNDIINDCITNDYSGTFDVASTHNIGNKAASELAFGAKWSTDTADTNTENKLVDSGATFITDDVQVGSVVKNTTDTTYGYVTAVDSETALSLDSDVFPDGDEGYEVYKNMYGAVAFKDEGNDDFHLNAADTVAQSKGVDLGANTYSISDDIDGDARP